MRLLQAPERAAMCRQQLTQPAHAGTYRLRPALTGSDSKILLLYEHL